VRHSRKGKSQPQPAPNAPKSLFRRVERTLDTIERGEDILGTIRIVADHMTRNFRDDLGIIGGRIYQLSEDSYELVHGFGSATNAPIGTRVSRTYAAIEAVLESGLVVMDKNAPELDPEIESQLGTRQHFAAVSVADGDFVISFDLASAAIPMDDLRSSLNIVRLAVNQKLRQERYQEIMEEARRIQVSILPKRIPRYSDFDIAGDSLPADVVGGDFYDYIPLTPELLDLVIADASGHGLPAALQVRDVYMGLRMGLTRDYNLPSTLERLNNLISRSKLASKFVSLFVCELETSGNVFYVNAGHVVPFILRDDGDIEYLREGGRVVGPSPDATYLRGFARLLQGDTLVLFTDGITECRHHRTGEEFGLGRLQRLVRRHSDRPATEIVRAIFQTVASFAGRAIPEDDQTVVIVRRPPNDARGPA